MSIMSLPIALGGKGSPILSDFVRSIQLNFIREFLDPKPAIWKTLSSKCLQIFANFSSNVLFFQIDPHPQSFKFSKLSPFFKTLLVSWNKFLADKQTRLDRQHIENQPLFFNSEIRNPANFRSLQPRLDFAKALPNVGRVADIINFARPGFLSIEQINELHNVELSPLSYSKILNSIPQTWKEVILSTTPVPFEEPPLIFKRFLPSGNLKATPISEANTKNLYMSLTQPSWERAYKGTTLTDRPFYRFYWENHLTPPINWPKIFKAIHTFNTDRTIACLLYTSDAADE